MPDSEDEDGLTDEQVEEIVRESLEMGDCGLIETVDGECSRCDRDATWRDPVGGDLFCEKHATAFFRERH